MEEASKLLPGPNSTLLQHKSHQRRRRLRILSQSRSRISPPPPPPFLVGDGGKNRGRRLTRIEATGRGGRRRTSTAILLCFFRLSGPSPFFLPLMVYLPICLVLLPREGGRERRLRHTPPLFHSLAGDGTKAQLMCEEEEEGGEGKKGTFLSLCCGGERGLDRVRERGKNRKLFVTNDAFHLLFPSAVLYWLTKKFSILGSYLVQSAFSLRNCVSHNPPQSLPIKLRTQLKQSPPLSIAKKVVR